MIQSFELPLSRRTRGLLALSVVICAMAGVAAVATRNWIAAALVWNLFLAWIPYGLGRWIRRLALCREHGTGLLIGPTLLWLLFFPNAPYIVTDLVHLHRLPSTLLVPGALLISATAALALGLGLLSLRDVHRVVARRLGTTWGWTFVGSVCALCGIGVWMGRVLRWNSWDAFTRPLDVLQSSLEGLLGNPLAAGFAAGFGLGLFLLYRWTLGMSVRSPRS